MDSALALILIFAILFQLTAAGFALYFIKYTGFKFSWTFIAIALFLMSIRRAIPLYLLNTYPGYSLDLTNEVIGLILSILMLFGVRGIGYLFIERKTAEEKIKALLKEKELILKEVHHRIKNNMSTTYNLLVLQSESLTDKEAKKAIDNAASRVQAMLALYEELFITGSYSDVSLKNYLPALAEKTISNFPNRKIVKLKVDSDECTLSEKKISSLGLIINELLTNIMKYAFAGKDSGEILVQLRNNSNNILLTIEDNGNGIPEKEDLKSPTGFGLSLVETLTNQLEGTISFDGSNGTKVTLVFDAN
jgi:two-component sensor histidine kinase